MNGFKHNPKIVEKRPVLPVLKIKINPLAEAERVAAHNLGQTADARYAFEPQVINVRIRFNLRRQMGPRTDQAHVAAKHIPELGKLVQARLPQKGANLRNPRVIGQLEERAVWALVQVEQVFLQCLGIGNHRTELCKAYCLAVNADPLAHVKNLAPVLFLDQGGNDQHEGTERDQAENGAGNVDKPLDAQHDERIPVRTKPLDRGNRGKPLVPGRGMRQEGNIRYQIVANAVILAPAGAFRKGIGAQGRIHTDNQLVHLAGKKKGGQRLPERNGSFLERGPVMPHSVQAQKLAAKVFRIVDILEEAFDGNALVIAADQHDILAEKAEPGQMGNPEILERLHKGVEADQNEALFNHVMRRKLAQEGVVRIFQNQVHDKAEQKVPEYEGEGALEIMVIRPVIEVVPHKEKVDQAEGSGEPQIRVIHHQGRNEGHDSVKTKEQCQVEDKNGHKLDIGRLHDCA